MRGQLANKDIGRALLASVILSCFLLILSVWLGCLLWSFHRNLATAEESNDVLQQQLSMAADTLMQVSGRIKLLRREMEAASPGELPLPSQATIQHGTNRGTRLSPEQQRAYLQFLTLLWSGRELARGLETASGKDAMELQAQLAATKQRLQQLLRQERETILAAIVRELGCDDREAALVVEALRSAGAAGKGAAEDGAAPVQSEWSR